MTETKTKTTDAQPDADVGLAFDPAASIHVRMARILAELPAIGKDQRNETQNFMYRGYDDVLNALNPLMAKHGVYLVPDVLERIASSERRTNNGKTMYEVNLHVAYRFIGLAGDEVSATGWGEGTDMGDKATNKAMTMALKYVLFQVFAISTAEASDTDASAPEETTTDVPQTPEPKDRPKDWVMIKKWVDEGYDRETWNAWLEFIGDAAQSQFGKRDGLDADDKARLGVLAAKATGFLYDIIPPGGAVPPTRAQMQEAWGNVLPELRFPGPQWRMGPNETDRPVRDAGSDFQAPERTGGR